MQVLSTIFELHRGFSSEIEASLAETWMDSPLDWLESDTESGFFSFSPVECIQNAGLDGAGSDME